MAEDEKKGKDFKVVDRRINFDEDSDSSESPPEAVEADTDAEAPEAISDAEAPDAEAQKDEKPSEPSGPGCAEDSGQVLPPITFSTFVLSISTSALIHLGCTPDPTTGDCVKEIQAAKQTIDLLGILQEKTKGNLSKEEEELLKSILFDLRMRYVEETKKG